MNEPGLELNIGELSKPVTVLIEKISEAIGGIFRPYQIRRIAQAESEADRVRAISQIEITELQRRAIYRFFSEEAKKQANIESITQKAIPDVDQDAQTQNVDDDWIVHFFDKCRLVSDDDMQRLWAQVLAGEANSPGTYSKRAINVLSTLNKSEADLFQNLCSFSWMLRNSSTLLIYDYHESIYTDQGVNFANLSHLNDIGLIKFDTHAGLLLNDLPQTIKSYFCKYEVRIEFPKPENNVLEVDSVMLTRAGRELSRNCQLAHKIEFRDYIIKKWRSRGYKVEWEDADRSDNPFRCKPEEEI